MIARRLLLSVLALAAPSAADQGMWMPPQIPELEARLREIGFTGDPRTFADLTGFPMDAVISLGGCSAAFVSPDGLIATNHHCVQRALQHNSTPGHNLIEDGFLARTREEELWAGPGSRVHVTVSFREVTAEVTGALDPRLPDRERTLTRDRRVKRLVAACEKGGLRCQVTPFFEGLRWFEIAQLQIEDLRLVYAPPRGIGNFGGETDNWQWPRHTGDFSLGRAYWSPAGKAAPHAKDNVPYRPRHWLQVSAEGASPGQVVFVAGYPGRTYRHDTLPEVRERLDWELPRTVRRYRALSALLQDLGRTDPALAIKAEPRLRGYDNTLKKAAGVIEGLLAGGLAQKEGDTRDLEAWIAADPARTAEFGHVLPGLARLQAERSSSRERDAVLADLYKASSLLDAADTLYRLALERPKPDLERDEDFQQRQWTRIRERLARMDRSYDPRLERTLLGYVLAEAAALPPEERLEPLDRLLGLKPGQPTEEAAGRIASWLGTLVGGSRLGEAAGRDPLFARSAREIAALPDPAVELALALHPLAQARRDRDKAREGAESRLRPLHMKALLARAGGLVAPDANSTLRVTFGTVKGVPARDGLFYLPQTTLRGVVAKHTGEGEFATPTRLLEAARALHSGAAPSPYLDSKLRDVPVCYLSDVDTTGGNSGSATLDAQGRLVGLLFDGTYESVASDYVFDAERTRSIHVDSRYLLWVLGAVERAPHLLEEMGIR